MRAVLVTITRFTDEHFPGFVECELVDVAGRTWKFEEKVPIVSSEDLWTDSKYPKKGFIACNVLRRGEDAAGRKVVTVETSPWGIESVEGATVFDLFAEQLEGDSADN
jgi:hypothetical protein